MPHLLLSHFTIHRRGQHTIYLVIKSHIKQTNKNNSFNNYSEGFHARNKITELTVLRSNEQ